MREITGLIGKGATISHVCVLFDMTPRAIRFYEERGLISPARDRKNRRIFDGPARKRLKLIADLRRAGLPLREIGALLEAASNEAALAVGARQLLCDRLEALEETRRGLVQAIAALSPGDRDGVASQPIARPGARTASAGAVD
jgi:DNA-binding transcriptional MerR regulator